MTPMVISLSLNVPIRSRISKASIPFLRKNSTKGLTTAPANQATVREIG